MTIPTRTEAGEVLLRLVHAADDRDTDLPIVKGSFTEGARDTASVWIVVGGKYFSVNMVALDPSDEEVAWHANPTLPTR